jgi:hypothetical protein
MEEGEISGKIITGEYNFLLFSKDAGFGITGI